MCERYPQDKRIQSELRSPSLCPIGVIVLFAITPVLPAAEPLSSKKVDFFEKRIRPLLVTYCYECHGPDDPSGKLRLDSKAGWMLGGERGPAIVPGDPSASLLIRAVSDQDKKLKMPPPDSGTRLSEQQIRDLAFWVRQGAVDPRDDNSTARPIELAAKTHWAFQPIRPPKIGAAQHPIDYLIDKRLQEKGFAATAAADQRTLIRRATYDLHGLPPTSEQLNTKREDFTHLIDTLLASPRYGERWARHWLDVARYSDAKDGVLMYGDARIRPFAYTYRDYVIRAFNDDKPFDQFVHEQIAADQLSLPAESPNLAAMGLLTLGRMFDRNPHDVIDDQIDVITRGFLGLTVSCARCHDHKFDPVPTADYYSLYGVFASSLEPYDRPRVERVSDEGTAHEKELTHKLREVFSVRQEHYRRTLETARDRTPDYLVQVATTKPDISETTIFFLSLLPEQLRPQITYKWRKLIARRAYPEDPIFGPWHDMMQLPQPKLRVESWKKRGIDQRIIDGLVAANPKSPEQIARTYGEIIRGVWARELDLKRQLANIQSSLSRLSGGPLNLADILAGGNGFGTGVKGAGIHPVTGKPTKGDVGFIQVERHDELIAVPDNAYIDGVFTPKSNSATITSTGIKISDVNPTSGQTWDYFKFGPSSGFTVNSIDGIDYNQEPNWMMAMHANKGITFDLDVMRSKHEFQSARFRTLFGHGGAKNESQLDFVLYLDGHPIAEVRDFHAQQKGAPIDVALPANARFLTLLVTEGKQGISHDQAMLGNPRIVPDQNQTISAGRRQRIAALEQQESKLEGQLENLDSLHDDPLAQLLLSKDSPVWFPINKIYYYLSRQDKDAFRGLVNQLDAISVKHKSAAGRAMVMVDSESPYSPVIFQRGDSSQPGTPVPRQFLKVASGKNRVPFTRGSGRLELAQAITSPENPLTARVWVNRVWMHHFGKPLVENPSDFGLRTQPPVHLDLLDYLAARLIDNGWRTKSIHRLIMTSAAYRRASRIESTDQLSKQLTMDPDNRYLWHANRRRLDLEQMRDTMLVIRGKVDFTMYGRPPLITDLNNHRRTIYAFVERQNLPNLIQTFDFANADTSTSRRVTTTVPQQALFVMNSEFISEAATGLAQRTAGGTDSARIQDLYQLALGRYPSSEELDESVRFVKSSSWELYAQVLLMTNELLFVD